VLDQVAAAGATGSRKTARATKDRESHRCRVPPDACTQA
jgi:hypothetical protein